MKEFLSFIKKEFRHIFRDRRTILIVLVMPIVQIILFGFAVSTEVHDARVDVVGDLADPSVRQTVARIDQNPYLHVTAVLGSVAEVAERFRAGKSDVAVCFERNFDERLRHYDKAFIRILGDGSDPNTAQMIVNYVNGVLSTVQSELSASEGTQTASFPHVQYMYNPAVRSSYNFVPGVMGLILMLVCSMMTAISIVREKERGTIEQINVTPVNRGAFILCKLIPYWLVAFFVLTACLLIARWVFGYTCAGSVGLMYFFTAGNILVTAGMGLLISNYSDNAQQAMFVTWFFMMVFMLVSGIFTPIASMPGWAQAITYLNPMRYYADAMRGIYIKGSSLADVWTDAAGLLTIGAAMVSWAILSYKKTN